MSASTSPPSTGADTAPLAPPSPASQQQPARIRRNTACVACRDAKVRCNASQTPNQPCLRCSKLDLSCVVDKTHKRTSRRSKLEELAAEVRVMKEGLTPRSSGSVAPEIQSSGLVAQLPVPGLHPTQQPLPQTFPSTPLAFDSSRPYAVPVATQMMTPSVNSDVQASVARPAEPRALASRVFSGEDIEYYFQMYFEHFHPYLPIVRTRDPNLCYKRGHILFWAIIFTACRRFARDDSVFTFLIETLSPQIWSAVSEPPLSLSVINALLILATWPSPRIRFLSDPSLIFSGIALHSSFLSGIHIGRVSHAELYSAAYKHKYTGITDEEVAYTWAGCNIVSHKVSAYQGCPSGGSLFNHAIDKILSGQSSFAMPLGFIVSLEAARFSNRVSRTMAASLEETNGVPHHVVTRLEEEFLKLQGAFYSDTSDMDNFTLLSALLDTQIFYFRPLPGYDEATLKRNVLRCYNTAETMIGTAQKLHRETAFLHYAPHYVFRTVLSATCIMLLMHFSDCLKPSQTETADALIREALRLMRICSMQDGDICTRASSLIETYWNMRAHMPRLDLTEIGFSYRLGAGLVFDSLVRWKGCFRDARGASSSNPPAPGAEASQEDPQPGPNTDLGLADPFQSVDWNAFIDDFDWSFTSNNLGVA